jgi:predicted ATPase
MLFKESGTGREIAQMNWSDGMLRAICLIILPTARFLKAGGGFLRPSLIFVDEIENGLDFNTLSHIIGFYESYGSHMQVIISSHSPTICNLVGAEKWRIAKRNGSTIEVFSPKDVEGDLEEQRKKLLKDNWEFYRRHIAKSKLYSVN